MSESRRIVIVGGGRHGRVVHDVCEALGWKVVGILDDTKRAGSYVNDVPVLGGFADHTRVGGPSVAFHVAVGDNAARARIAREIEQAGGTLATIVDPTVRVSRFAEIGLGAFVGPFSRVRPNARIGWCALVEGSAGIGTDSILEKATFIGPGCQLTAGSRVDEGAMLGAGATVLESRVGAWSVVGAGATLICDLPERVLAVGTPAQVKKQLT